MRRHRLSAVRPARDTTHTGPEQPRSHPGGIGAGSLWGEVSSVIDGQGDHADVPNRPLPATSATGPLASAKRRAGPRCAGATTARAPQEGNVAGWTGRGDAGMLCHGSPGDEARTGRACRAGALTCSALT